MVWRLLGFVGYVSDVSSAGSTRVRPGESSMLGFVAGACHLSIGRTCFDTCEVSWDALPDIPITAFLVVLAYPGDQG